MAKRTDIEKILVIGSGPIIIGQAAEFDYAGSQACQALREEGYKVVLINSNPATIMTDREMADKVYLEPLTLEFAKRIIHKERPDAILGTLGGQTGLNLVVQLQEDGILNQYGVEILGTDLEAIRKAEDREAFRQLMENINKPVPQSIIASSVDEAVQFAESCGYPVVVRPAYTLGGTGGGFADNLQQLSEICRAGLKASPLGQCLIEQSIAGFKEIEYEVMRDASDNAIVVCNMENIDPVGIHTGDSAVVAPCQTLTDRENQLLRDASLDIIRALKICGGCNVQLALSPKSMEYYVIEVNPRVSRSSALASKATGYPIAKISAKLAVGFTLDEIINPVTGTSFACFEPALDYVVTKLPRFPFDKFPKADRHLFTQMKATGEVMAIGRNFSQSFLKGIRSLELKVNHIKLKSLESMDLTELREKIQRQDDERLFAVAQWIRKGYCLDEVHQMTKIDYFFLYKIKEIVELEKKLEKKNSLKELDVDLLKSLKNAGFSDGYIGTCLNASEYEVWQYRKASSVLPVYKMVDTCAREFESATPYFYSTYEDENESNLSAAAKVVVLGSGPIRIGQGIEFDYSTVHCVKTLREEGFEAIVINSNPETVSTDFSISNKLYFEPLTVEDVMNVIELERPLGVIVQFGGQTAINLAHSLVERGVKILGTSIDSIAKAEDRNSFEQLLKDLGIPQPPGRTAYNVEEALEIPKEIGYPVLVRPSYVLGGRAMEIVRDDQQLIEYMSQAVMEISHDAPVLIDRYIVGKELEIDAICDGENVFVPGVMEHIERAGVHSGDSICVYPTQGISTQVKNTIIKYSEQIGRAVGFVGLFNIQFIVDRQNRVYVLEVNPRSSRSVPFLSKITATPMSQIATRCILGKSLKAQGVHQLYKEDEGKFVFVKCPVFSFAKLRSVDTVLGPEMKSTGEALGYDVNLQKALYKALVASGVKLEKYGNVLMTIADIDKEEALGLARSLHNIGYGIYGTKGTCNFLREHGIMAHSVGKVSDEENTVLDIIKSGVVSFVINTTSQDEHSNSMDGFLIRRVAAENSVFVMTSLDTAKALVGVLESQTFTMVSISEGIV